MTDEEKAARAEEAAREEAKLRAKKTTLATAFLKEKLEQEERNTRISLRKLNEQWRTILRTAKAKELQKDISILHQTFERMLDRRDATIKALIKDLAEAEKQESMAVQSHITLVDKLLRQHHNVVTKRRQVFNADIDSLRDEFLTERRLILERHERDLNNVKDMMFAMKMQYEEIENEATDEFNSKRDDQKTKNMEATENLKQHLENIISDLWDMFQQALSNYKQNTQAKQEEFEILRDKDKQDAATIERQVRKLNKMMNEYNGYRQQLQTMQADYDERNSALRYEKDAILKEFQKLKEKMTQNRGKERVELTELTVRSKECIDKLKKKVELANTILKQAEMCRKYETEQEKVLPFYQESVSQEEVEAEKREAAGGEEEEEDPLVELGLTKRMEEPPQDTAYATVPGEEERLVSDHDHLKLFWKRYNKALLDKAAAEKERSSLTEINQKLKTLLKQYLDGISVNHEVLQQENTLFVVNGRTNARVGIPVGDSRVQAVPPTVVEVSHVLSTLGANRT